ncbi:MAG: DMT family transporter [Candidatus Saliniplasma sp.]
MKLEIAGKKQTTVLLLSTVIWGLSFPAIKISLDQMQPLTLGLMRMVFGAVPLILYMLYTQSKDKIINTFKIGFLPITGIAVTQFFLPLAAQNIGMNMMDPESAASTSSILQATTPIFAIIFSSIFLKEYIGIKKALGTSIGLVGTVMLVSEGGRFVFGSYVVGNLLLLSTAVSYGYSGIIAKKNLGDIDPLPMITFSMIIATFFFLPTSLLNEPVSHLTEVSMNVWIFVLFLGFVCNGIAMIMWYIVLTSNELSKQISFTYLIPLFGVIFSNLFIGEIIGIRTVVFGMITIFGISIAQYGRKKKPLRE